MSVFSSHRDILRQARTSSGNKNTSKYLGS